MDLATFFIIFLAIPCMILLIMVGRKRQDTIDSAWRAAASELGGVFSPRETSFFNSKPRQIRAEILGASIEIDHYSRRVNNSTVYYTRLKAQTSAPYDFRLKVYESGALSGLARLVGFQDIPTGNEAFDERFIVKSNTPDVVPLWLNARVRGPINRAPEFQYSLRDGKLEAITQSLSSSSSQLVRAARAVAALSDGRQRLLRAWKKLAKAQGGTVTKQDHGLAEIHLERDGLGVIVEVTRRGDRYYTSVTAQVAGARLRPFVLSNEPHLYASPLPQADDSFSIEGYHLWTEEPRKLADILAEIDGPLKALKGSKLRVDDKRVRILWPGIEMSGKRIERAVSLAVLVAESGDHGPYR